MDGTAPFPAFNGEYRFWEDSLGDKNTDISIYNCTLKSRISYNSDGFYKNSIKHPKEVRQI